MTQLQPLGKRPAARPVWLTIVLILVLLAALFGLGFGIATLIRGDEVPTPSATESASAAPVNPAPCQTTMIVPAEILPMKDDVVLNVYNATKKKGLAAQAALDFKREGFRINKIENDPLGANISGVAEIRYGPKAEAAAKLVEYYLAGATMVPIDRANNRVDVALGKGYTQLADGGAVAAVLAQPTPSVSGPGCPTPTE
ncbi:MAG: hypothetical protein RJB01_1126 [Actinomycetota bacterium]